MAKETSILDEIIADLDANPSAFEEHFRAAVSTEDALGILIRAHLYAENELVRCLRRFMPLYDEAKLDLSFAAKLDVLSALGAIGKNHLRAYKQLNTLRNEFSHKSVQGGMPEVTQSEVRRLWDSIDVSLRRSTVNPYDDGVDFKISLRLMLSALVGFLFSLSLVLQNEQIRSSIVRENLAARL